MIDSYLQEDDIDSLITFLRAHSSIYTNGPEAKLRAVISTRLEQLGGTPEQISDLVEKQDKNSHG